MNEAIQVLGEVFGRSLDCAKREAHLADLRPLKLEASRS